MSSHNDSFAASGSSPTRRGDAPSPPDFLVENHFSVLRVSIRTTGRTWLIQPGEPEFTNIMATPLTGKKGPAQQARRKTVSR
jgi:hypothetical protein